MRSRIPYSVFERRRLGNPRTPWAGVRHMLRRSFGAPSFAQFWRYWNPLFGYLLYYLCYRPLARRSPRAFALPLTFAASGAVHDLFASLVTADVFVLFTPAFTAFGLLIVAEEAFGFDMRGLSVRLRALTHFVVIAGTLGLGLFVRAL